jgi:hypothetical protein
MYGVYGLLFVEGKDSIGSQGCKNTFGYRQIQLIQPLQVDSTHDNKGHQGHRVSR